MIKYYFLLKVLLLLIFSANTYADKLEKVSLQLHWKHQFEFAGFYAAVEKGFYKAEGLEVEIKEIEASHNSIDEVVNLKSNFGVSYSSIVSEYMKGKPVVMIANIFKHSALVLITQEYIEKPSDLIGKKVMADSVSVESSGVNNMLRNHNISLSDITLVEQTFRLDDFIDKKVDAMTGYITNEPYHLNLKGIQYNVLNPVNYGSGFYDVNLFTSLDESIKHPQRTEAFVRASLKGWEYALTHSSEMIEIILKKYNTQNKTKEALEYEASIVKNLVLPYVYELGSIDRNIIQKMAREYASQNNISYKNIDFTNFYIDGEITNKADTRKYFYLKLFAGFFLVLLLVVYRYNVVIANSHKMKKNINIIDENVLISYSDSDGNITDVSEALCRYTGYEKDELIGQNHRIFKHPDTSTELFEKLWDTVLKGETFSGEIKNLKKSGEIYWVNATITPIFDKRGRIEGFSAIRKDITDEKKAQELAITDQLTQIYNRLHLENIFKSEIKRAERYGSTYSIVLIDVDYFKVINDSFGHAVGDQALINIADMFSEHIRDVDILGRWGGEEFLIICTQTTLADAEKLAQKLRVVIAEHNFANVGTITCSFGVSEYKKNDTGSNDVIKRADDALYDSKNNGRDIVTICP